MWFKNRRAKYRKKQKLLSDQSSKKGSVDMNDDNISECSSINEHTSTLKPKNANESTISDLMHHQISSMTPISSLSYNNEQHLKNSSSIENFLGKDEQSKWRSTKHKYHIESLLQ